MEESSGKLSAKERRLKQQREKLEALPLFRDVFREECINEGVMQVLNNAEDRCNLKKMRSNVETVELQLGFDLNVRRDIKLSIYKYLEFPSGKFRWKQTSMCVWVRDEGCQMYRDCLRRGIDCLTQNDLSQFKRNKKKVKKLCLKYRFLFAANNVIRMTPRLIGPHICRMGKFPRSFDENVTSLDELIKIAESSYRVVIKTRNLQKSCNVCVPVGHVRMTEEEIGMNVRYALRQIVCEFPNQWDDLASVYLKSTQTQSVSVLRRYPEISHEHARHLIRFAIRDSDGQFIIYVPNDIQGLLSEFIRSAKKETHQRFDEKSYSMLFDPHILG